MHLSNWAGNHTYHAEALHYPEDVPQLQALVRGGARLKALGTRHTFNEIGHTDGGLVSLEKLDEITLDPERRTVTIGGGVAYAQLSPVLHQAGWALPNLASLPHISVAGACATATHGSGVRNQVLAAAVSGLELVAGTGEVVTLDREREGDRLQGTVVGLGALGVVARLTLDLIPTFEIRQEVFEELPLAELERQFDAIVSSAYSVSLFTDWQGDRVAQAWLKHRVTDSSPHPPHDSFFGARPAAVSRHPIAGFPADCCTEQGGVPGPWQERLPHFRADRKPSAGEELQSEYLLPRRHAVSAVRALSALQHPLAPVLQVSEIRTIAADTLWMSPCYQEDCVAFHFTWVKDWERVRPVLAQLEATLAPFEARPHWGKLFLMEREQLGALFPRLDDFRNLVREFDPEGKFRNAFLDRILF